jgi:hypothetical protein
VKEAVRKELELEVIFSESSQILAPKHLHVVPPYQINHYKNKKIDNLMGEGSLISKSLTISLRIIYFLKL